jgi:hypothetical protein
MFTKIKFISLKGITFGDICFRDIKVRPPQYSVLSFLNRLKNFPFGVLNMEHYTVDLICEFCRLNGSKYEKTL